MSFVAADGNKMAVIAHENQGKDLTILRNLAETP
jgi:hypothetical protein